MKRYPKEQLANHSSKDFFFKYEIIVPDAETKKEMMDAFKTIHDMRDVDTDIVMINQLAHEYEYDGCHITIRRKVNESK